MTNEEFIESIRLPNEEWRDVVGYEGYYMVSSLGRVIRTNTSKVRSNFRGMAVTRPRLLNPTVVCKRKQKYCFMYLHKDNKRKRFYFHRIVALAFVPNPYNKPEIDHIDGDGTNNKASNLKWCTRSENNMNPIARQRQSISHLKKQQPTLWRAVVCVLKNGEVKHFKSISDAEKYGYGRTTIINSCKNPNIIPRKFKWYYLEDYQKLLSSSNVKELIPIQ